MDDPGGIVALLPMVGFCMCMTCLISLFVILVVVLIKKQKKDSYTGVVEDKMVRTSSDFDTNVETDYYTIVIKTDDGRSLKVGLSKQEFDGYEKGDRVKKDVGKLKPVKIA